MESRICEECQKLPSEYYCESCQELLCWLCDKSIHLKGNRQNHFRAALCHSCQNVSNFMCQYCCIPTCAVCIYSHINHNLIPISCLYSTVVYWDNGIFSPVKENFFLALEKLKSKYQKLKKIKVFGKKLELDDKVVDGVEIEYLDTGEDMRVIFIDISLLYQFIGHILVVTDKVEVCKPYFQKILATVDIKKIKVAYWNDYLNEIDVDDIKEQSSTLDKFMCQEEFSHKLNQSCRWLLSYLKSSAEKGKIQTAFSSLKLLLSSQLNLDNNQVTELITYLYDHKLIHLQEKQFTAQIKEKFLSLPVSHLTNQTLYYAICSLKQDEMLPTERAILARLKEAFDFKPKAEDWSKFLKTCILPQRFTQDTQDFSLFSTQNNQTFMFTIKKHKEPLFNTDTYLIYPLNEKWKSYDKYLKSGDILNIKPTEDWNDLKKFFIEYFSVDDYEDYGIPGGRYGCAQFLKHFSSENLKNCSVGKLNYMVQLAIDEDFLRYQKNLLVWSQCLKVDNCYDVQGKIKKIGESLLEILNRFRDGISLAQLPGALSAAVGFQLDLQKLGFAKLKDLVLGVEGVSIIRKSNKHQFAILTKYV